MNKRKAMSFKWIGEKWAFEGSTRVEIWYVFLFFWFFFFLYTSFGLIIRCLLYNCSWFVVSTYVDCFSLFLYVLLLSLKIKFLFFGFLQHIVILSVFESLFYTLTYSWIIILFQICISSSWSFQFFFSVYCFYDLLFTLNYSFEPSHWFCPSTLTPLQNSTYHTKANFTLSLTHTCPSVPLGHDPCQHQRPLQEEERAEQACPRAGCGSGGSHAKLHWAWGRDRLWEPWHQGRDAGRCRGGSQDR